MGRVKSGKKEKRSMEGLNYSLGLPSDQGSCTIRQWMNYLMNLTYIYNSSTAPRLKNIIIINII